MMGCKFKNPDAASEMVDSYFAELRMSFDWMLERTEIMGQEERDHISMQPMFHLAVESFIDIVFRQPPVSGCPQMWSSMDESQRGFLKPHVEKMVRRIGDRQKCEVTWLASRHERGNGPRA